MTPEELEAIRERTTAALDSQQSATDDRAALLAEVDRLRAALSRVERLVNYAQPYAARLCRAVLEPL